MYQLLKDDHRTPVLQLARSRSNKDGSKRWFKDSSRKIVLKQAQTVKIRLKNISGNILG